MAGKRKKIHLDLGGFVLESLGETPGGRSFRTQGEPGQ